MAKKSSKQRRAEKRILSLLIEVGWIVREYGSDNLITLSVNPSTGYVRFNNSYWEGGADENAPINYMAFCKDFVSDRGVDDD